MHHSHRPKNRINSLIQDQKSNKYIANGYKNQVRAFKREAVQFLMAKNIAVNHLLLEALWTKRHSRGGRVVTFALSQTDTVRGAGALIRPETAHACMTHETPDLKKNVVNKI